MEYILDASKWICGFDGDFALHGDLCHETAMLNDEGFMCCLGQFGSQKLEELGEDVELNMIDAGDPCDVARRVESVYDSLFVTAPGPEDEDEDDWFENTQLSEDLMVINDAMDTTPREKVVQIEAKLKEYGHTLKVINEEHLDDWKLRNE